MRSLVGLLLGVQMEVGSCLKEQRECERSVQALEGGGCVWGLVSAGRMESGDTGSCAPALAGRRAARSTALSASDITWITGTFRNWDTEGCFDARSFQRWCCRRTTPVRAWWGGGLESKERLMGSFLNPLHWCWMRKAGSIMHGHANTWTSSCFLLPRAACPQPSPLLRRPDVAGEVQGSILPSVECKAWRDAKKSVIWNGGWKSKQAVSAHFTWLMKCHSPSFLKVCFGTGEGTSLSLASLL